MNWRIKQFAKKQNYENITNSISLAYIQPQLRENYL
jgi:hypothetical protein